MSLSKCQKKQLNICSHQQALSTILAMFLLHLLGEFVELYHFMFYLLISIFLCSCAFCFVFIFSISILLLLIVFSKLKFHFLIRDSRNFITAGFCIYLGKKSDITLGPTSIRLSSKQISQNNKYSKYFSSEFSDPGPQDGSGVSLLLHTRLELVAGSCTNWRPTMRLCNHLNQVCCSGDILYLKSAGQQTLRSWVGDYCFSQFDPGQIRMTNIQITATSNLQLLLHVFVLEGSVSQRKEQQWLQFHGPQKLDDACT